MSCQGRAVVAPAVAGTVVLCQQQRVCQQHSMSMEAGACSPAIVTGRCKQHQTSAKYKIAVTASELNIAADAHLCLAGKSNTHGGLPMQQLMGLLLLLARMRPLDNFLFWLTAASN